MNQDKFMEYAVSQFAVEKQIMRDKGKEYTMSSNDKLHNFKAIGEMLGIKPEAVIAIYWLKHVFSIVNYIQTGKEECDEEIEGRVHDCRNYLLLLGAMIKERKELVELAKQH